MLRTRRRDLYAAARQGGCLGILAWYGGERGRRTESVVLPVEEECCCQHRKVFGIVGVASASCGEERLAAGVDSDWLEMREMEGREGTFFDQVG
jgi:hypothetical protein